MNRRQFAASAGALMLTGTASAQKNAGSRDTWTPTGPPTGPRIQIGMLMFPEMFAIDLVGPYTFLNGLMNVDTHLVSKSLSPVTTHKPMGTTLNPMQIVPTTTLEECPKQLDILFVPGGTVGVNQVMRDDTLLDFVADRGSRAKYVTSVCTGALVLGAAGLLKGYNAATHWTAMDILPVFGATPVQQRVVEDRNRITGGGVTAGIDFGLVLASRLRGEDFAKFSQLAMEYDPQPPYHSGSPRTASPALVKHVEQMGQKMHEASRSAGSEAMKRRGLA